ncbi:unnamed protein product [Pipistrellus nathusii]|uniref:GAGE domain-containing protein n=1 Tax=Pipistrellus nathusii TaxID=59473 RepID=A0ABP0AHK5_PIPNA
MKKVRIVAVKVDCNTILIEDVESEQQVGPVADQPPSDKKPKLEESPSESQDVTPEEEHADAGAPEVQVTTPETDNQELDKPVTGPEGGDDPDVVGHACGNPEPIEIPETGEEKPSV